MPLYRYGGKLLRTPGGLAGHSRCCCAPANCCDALPDTTYAIFENLSGCPGRDEVVPLTKTTDMSGTYWAGETSGDCSPKFVMKFRCNSNSVLPRHQNHSVEFESEPDPIGVPPCSRVPTAGNPSGAANANPDDDQDFPAGAGCLPVYWSYEQCEDLWEDSCCEEGGSFRLTWATSAPP